MALQDSRQPSSSRHARHARRRAQGSKVVLGLVAASVLALGRTSFVARPGGYGQSSVIRSGRATIGGSSSNSQVQRNQQGGVAGRRAKGETTLDRLTGPKLFKSVTKVEGIHAVPLLPLRVASGVLMIHHGSEGGFWPANFGTDGFNGFVTFIVKPYFGFLPGSPELWSAIHDYAEFWGGALLVIGLLTRPAAFTLFVTMCGAVYFHLASTGWQGFPFGHVESYSYNFEEPVLYAFIFLLFFFNGAGPVSVDAAIYSQIGGESDQD